MANTSHTACGILAHKHINYVYPLLAVAVHLFDVNDPITCSNLIIYPATPTFHHPSHICQYKYLSSPAGYLATATYILERLFQEFYKVSRQVDLTITSHISFMS